jgi:hypothetical protein
LSDVGEADFGTIVEDLWQRGQFLAMRRSTATVKTPVSCLAAFHPGWICTTIGPRPLLVSGRRILISRKGKLSLRGQCAKTLEAAMQIDASTRKCWSLTRGCEWRPRLIIAVGTDRNKTAGGARAVGTAGFIPIAQFAEIGAAMQPVLALER